MISYVETIRLENGRFHLLNLHQQRLTATMREIYGDLLPSPDIKETLGKIVDIPNDGVYKCRIVYDTKIREVEFQPYKPRNVKSLRIVEASPTLDYHLKSCDRSQLSALAARKNESDDVIIVRDGLVTDTSYTNLVFYGQGIAYTPRTPLLEGVMRRWLIEEGILQEIDIHTDDLRPDNRLGITAVSLINAMLPLSSAPHLPLSSIHFP